MRILKRSVFFENLFNAAIVYPAPSNLTYMWNFGSLALFFLMIQIITGVFLAMHYVPNFEFAFYSVEHIMRDVNYGWILRYLHSNGASMFFIVVYLHMFRGLYYYSYLYPRSFLWICGVFILLIMIITAFIGYVLPWGQMSYWGATVITNLISAIPFFGKELVYWIWGGFSVDNPTLNRFFSFHYLFPFLILGLVLIHLLFLHEHCSNNMLGINFNVDRVPFGYFYIIKDVFGLIVFLFIYTGLVFYFPNLLGHSDNYILANPLVTPAHIVPEWYFLPFYAILRTVPNKLGGVIVLILAIFVLCVIPYIHDSSVRSSMFRPFLKICFWLFFFDCMLLGWVGGKPIESPYFELSRIGTFFYFLYLLCIVPFVVKVEKIFWKH